MIKQVPLHRFLLWVGLFLVVVGAKLWCVSLAGSSVPYRDQIDAEGETIIRPWLEDRLEASAFWEPHNEHRIVFTKLIAWGVVALNGQWDAYIQVALNAGIHAAFLIIVLCWLRDFVRGWPFLVISGIGVLLWVLPLDWENTLQGFQSQVYLMMLFSFLHVRGILSTEKINFPWIAAHGCGFLALGAMAGGMLSGVAILVTLGLRAWTTKTLGQRNRIDLAIVATTVLLGLLIRTDVPGHAWLKAQNLSEFFGALGAVMAWPVRDFQPWAILMGVPVLVVGYRLARRKTLQQFEVSFLGVVVWLGLIVVATAAYRGHGSPLVSRYLTNYTLLVMAQGVALTLLPHLKWGRGALAVWAIVTTFALISSVGPLLERNLRPRSSLVDRQESVVREYLWSGNPRAILEAPVRDLPYPSASVLVQRWSHENIRSVLPAAVRAPVAVTESMPTVPDSLPASPHPVLVASPQAAQTESWIWQSPRQSDEASRFLRFKISGALGDPESAMTMKLVSDTESFEVVPDGAARNRWKTINVWRPKGEWWIEIEDSDSLEYIAISPPVELGTLSWAVEKFIKYHLWWLSLGGALLVAGGATWVTFKARGTIRGGAAQRPSPSF
ncbi:MAG: hypothetical protein SynsKO_20440 [Synoicihabitans sp.]